MQTLHRLEFLSTNEPVSLDGTFLAFKVGTCHGLWRPTSKYYDILAIINDEPGNGHLNDVFEWFEASCRRDGKSFRILEIWNERFKTHLLTKRGFRKAGKNNAIKHFT